MKCNLLVDTNFILYKNTHILKKSLYADLLPSLIAAFDEFMKMYPFENIYLITDTRSSWRSRFLPSYKGSRIKDDKIDWVFVFNTYSQFKDIMRDNLRVTVLEEEEVEGDDWISTIIKKSNSKNLSTLTIASDADLQQLLDYRTDPKWINMIWRNNFSNPELYLPKGYPLFIRELEKGSNDPFDINNDFGFLRMIKTITTRSPIVEVDKEQLLFEKIIQGDKSDNIPSVLLKKGTTGKFSGIGKAGATKIYENFKSDYDDSIDFMTNDWVDDVVCYVASNKKVELNETVSKMIKFNIENNIRLVQLDPKHLPEDIKDKIKNNLN